MPTNEVTAIAPETVLTDLDLRIMDQRSRVAISANTVGMWFDTVQRYGSGSAPWLGCLLAMVREAWGDSGLHAVPATAGPAAWVVFGSNYGPTFGDTEAEALVAALESAPSA